ncbi:hypothetical protein T11_4940 [Trichinella zimbabwensis]|uniref:Uncharacterized protein n=1 Tax=Trichinella zimbabwensis TaxID=268475 RepID=A0A0V1HZL7_9BILA|nr:hypothetical protein T11_4940 [Trichinella zimbabwensis]
MNAIFIEGINSDEDKSGTVDSRACIDGRCLQHRGVHLFLTRIECTSTDMYPFNIRIETGKHLCRDSCIFPLITSGTNYRQNNGGSAADRQTLFAAFSQIR